jgi:hypothetical protein
VHWAALWSGPPLVPKKKKQCLKTISKLGTKSKVRMKKSTQKNKRRDLFRKFFNSHLFWLNSHPGRACLVLRACRSAAFLDHDAKKGCEFNQKRCEFSFIYTAFLHFKLVFTSISFPILHLPYLPFHCCLPICFSFNQILQFLFPSFIKWYLPNFTCFSIAFQLAMKMGFAGETRAKRQAHFLVYSVQPNVMNCLALPILLHLKYTQKRL